MNHKMKRKSLLKSQFNKLNIKHALKTLTNFVETTAVMEDKAFSEFLIWKTSCQKEVILSKL